MRPSLAFLAAVLLSSPAALAGRGAPARPESATGAAAGADRVARLAGLAPPGAADTVIACPHPR
jgi:hypothetical protein